MFSFAEPAAQDTIEVQSAVEKYFEQQRRPWSEVAGPYASIQFRLLTPELGIVDARLTSYGSLILLNSTRARLVVRKESNGWRVLHLLRD